MDKTVKSPCIRNCCLDDKDICMGCFRHLDEITGWGQFSDQQRQTALKLASKRKGSYKHLLRFY
ncbi:MAG: DUF1289 domain-containing protein [Algicola sp.]|nr:DUF1289 domain-containing protein [Algicola sp.]